MFLRIVGFDVLQLYECVDFFIDEVIIVLLDFVLGVCWIEFFVRKCEVLVFQFFLVEVWVEGFRIYFYGLISDLRVFVDVVMFIVYVLND